MSRSAGSFFRGEPLILAHRGASAYAPDHSLTAIRRALADGADAIEADVHISRDGHPILHHGGDVSENTEARGPVHGHTLSELRALDAGHRWSPDGGRTYPFRGRGERILTVAEALETFPDARFNLDIKAHAAARPTRRVIDAHDAADRVLLASWFSWRRRPAIRGYPGARSITMDQMLAFMLLYWARLDALWKPPADALQIPERYYGIPLMSPRLVRRAGAHGMRIHVWTVNDEADMTRLLDWGVKGLVTDRPDLAVRVRARYLAERGAT